MFKFELDIFDISLIERSLIEFGASLAKKFVHKVLV